MKKIYLPLLLVFAILSLQGTPKENATIFNLKTFEKSLKYIPAGSFNDESILTHEKTPIHSVNSFHIYQHEVSNRDYLIFLSEIKLKDEAFYNSMLPDTLVWRDKLAYNEPYVELYFRHPSYRDYPVVGVSHEQAQHYCKWLTECYAKEKKRKFAKAEFRLPTSVEWEYAARGGLNLEPFPWGGPYLQNKKGEWLANFYIISQANIAKNTFDVKQPDGTIKDKEYLVADYYCSPGTATFDNLYIPTPVLSYFPNNYSLYNMAGNVEEFVAEAGIARGGSFRDTGYYLQNRVTERYDTDHSASAERGFRFVMITE